MSRHWRTALTLTCELFHCAMTDLAMLTRLCTYDDLTAEQRQQLRAINVHPEQLPYCGDIECALYSLPATPHAGIKGFVLLGDDLPVAFLLLKRAPLLAHWAEPGSATVHAFQVDKRLQGQGIGKTCLNLLARQLHGYWPEINQLMLSVSPFNTSALHFYKGQGWIEGGEAYQGERCLTLALHTPLASQQAG